MALTMTLKNNSNPEQGLFDALLTLPADKQLAASVLTIPNIKFVLGFYSVAVQFNNGTTSLGINLPVTVTSILKKTATPDQIVLCRKELVDLLASILEKAIPASEKLVTGKPTFTTFNFGAAVAAEEAKAAAKAKEKAKIFNPGEADTFMKKAATIPTTAVPLRQAQVLGQPVLGTSAGSVYKVAALSNTARLAMRYPPNKDKLSVRVEGNLTEADRARMDEFGMSKGQDASGEEYWSMHLTLGSVPVSRVVGAVLMGLGIEFQEVIKNPKEVL